MSNSSAMVRSAVSKGRAIGAWALLAIAAVLPAQQANDQRAPDLPPGCEDLRAPEGNKVSHRVYALGVQIYQWNLGTGRWDLVAPAALLYADAGYHSVIGSHFFGPTWMSNSGSSVIGSRMVSRTPDASAIAWLLLKAVSPVGPGPFADTTFIQRVATTGGLPPARVGAPNEIVEVPYAAEYYFYRAQ